MKYYFPLNSKTWTFIYDRSPNFLHTTSNAIHSNCLVEPQHNGCILKKDCKKNLYYCFFNTVLGISLRKCIKTCFPHASQVIAHKGKLTFVLHLNQNGKILKAFALVILSSLTFACPRKRTEYYPGHTAYSALYRSQSLGMNRQEYRQNNG